MSKSTANRRTKLIANFATDGIMVRKAIIHWTVFTLVAFLISGGIQFCSNPFASLDENLLTSARTFAPVLLTLVCLGPVFVYDLLKASNRIFGPIPRIQQIIRQLQQGEKVELLKVRDNDIHGELVTDINALIELVQGQARGEEIQDAEESAETFGAEADGEQRVLCEIQELWKAIDSVRQPRQSEVKSAEGGLRSLEQSNNA
ncbi:MAG: hypothetical protein ACE361_03210 [Aureliella sp.]